jgi:cell division protein FtsL
MTIIRQRKDSDTIQQWIIGLSIGAAFVAVSGVFFYNQVVNNTHEITQRRSAMRTIEVKNAELKGALYELTSSQNVESFAATNGLVVEKNPNYIKRQELSINL